ncbi:MAG: hypothetical protein M5U26_27780 [Planctomycetota bacterium]|nr:hypothetical protein [Planctomycetota bacterium]
MISRGKSVLMWDERVREMTDEQIRWLPPEVCLCLNEATGLGGRTGQPLLVALDRYRNLDRKVWGTAVRQPSFKYDAFDSLDAWAEAADLGYITGLVSAGWTREYSMGPLHEPPELAWPALLYASERAWGGMKNTHRQAFYSRFGARFHGLKEKAQQDRFWAVYDMHLREYPREAREVLHDLYEQCARHRSVLTLVDAWSSIGAFLYYVEHFDQAVASDFGNLQAGTADPFQAGRLRWRVEDLKAKTGDLVEHFRNACQHMSLPESAEEYLNCKMAYGLRRLDQLQEVLEAYPLPETDWQQPVRV